MHSTFQEFAIFWKSFSSLPPMASHGYTFLQQAWSCWSNWQVLNCGDGLMGQMADHGVHRATGMWTEPPAE